MITPNWKAKLQLWHLIFLFFVPVLYTILKLNSEPHDLVPNLLGNALIILGSIWGAYIVVMTVRHGDKETVLKNLLSEYRRQLGKSFFLIASNVLLTCMAAFLLYQLIVFRQVEFTSTSDIKLILSDVVGQPQLLGNVKERQPTKYRLKVGRRFLAYTQLNNGMLIALDPIVIPPLWSGKDVPSVDIKVEEQRYERPKFEDEEPEDPK